MTAKVDDRDSGNSAYQEREAVAIFADETSLNAAVDELMQAGLRQQDMSLLAHLDRFGGKSAEQLADSPSSPRAAFVSGDARTMGEAAVVATPALLAGMGAAIAVGTGGAALIPCLLVTMGSSAAAGGLGLVFARAFGRKRADQVKKQIVNGGIILWVHDPDPADDGRIVDILTRNGGQNVHVHVATRNWGVADVPFHDANPDPLLSDTPGNR